MTIESEESHSKKKVATHKVAAWRGTPVVEESPEVHGPSHEDRVPMERKKSLRNSNETTTTTTEEPEVTALQDLLAGGVAGSASVIVGHPFDTIKVRLQTSSGGSSSLGSLTSGFGGVSSLFRGMGAPLVSASIVNAIIFSSYGTSSRYWDTLIEPPPTSSSSTSNATQQQQDDTPPPSFQDSWQKSFFCGAFAGVMQALVICPTEHVKCRLQVQHGKGAADYVYKGPLQACRSILSNHGLSGLYRGWWATAWREVPAFGLYFTIYDACKDRITTFLAKRAGLDEETDDVPHSHLWISSATAGGLSGSLTWAVIYPLDVIKSRIQTAPLDLPVAQRRIWTVGKEICAQHGWRFLFRGLGVTLVRAFPVNGIIFPVYEFTLLHLSGQFDNDDDES